MIAITILLLLTFITATVVNNTMDSDRVPSGARRIQSYLEGARDRAIYSSKTLNPGPRGVRFLRDPNNLNTVTSMIYIGPPQVFSEGGVKIGEDLGRGKFNRRKIVPFKTNWGNLALRKFLLNGARIRLPAVHGQFYTMIFNTSDTDSTKHSWELTKDYPASKFPRTEYDYELFLEPAVLPNQEPRLLPRNVVIDVKPFIQDQPEHSRIPRFWNTNSYFRNRMDILFSPRGTIVGRSAVGGYIHLVVIDLADAEQGRFTGDPSKEGDEKIVTINSRTGSVTVHSVNLSFDTNGNQIPPTDPFRFAETGEEL